MILFISLLGSSIVVSISDSSGQEEKTIPGWIKNVAGWWGNDEISEKEFLTALEYMINHNIISLVTIPCSTLGTSSNESVPDWVKHNAGWWSENLIEDTDFISGIEYLMKKQIIAVDNKKILSDVPLDDVTFSSQWKIDKNYLAFVQSSFFEVYGLYGDCVIGSQGNLIWNSLFLGLNPNKMDLYNEVAVWNDPQKSVVVYPYFTSIAYSEQGFYDYYAGHCDSCTTTEFKPPIPLYTSSGVGHQALTLLGYSSITDIDIDKNPGILEQFDKVLMLHNEYVTRAMFDAITSHPNVIYLYPNALYAEIEVDYIDETITLIRGHNYPEHEIKNGFDWEFDNTHPYEYDSQCQTLEIYPIENGWMTNCYPENVFLRDSEQLFQILKAIKDL
jgi:hypothetical protein